MKTVDEMATEYDALRARRPLRIFADLEHERSEWPLPRTADQLPIPSLEESACPPH